MKNLLLPVLALFICRPEASGLDIRRAVGWNESLSVEWTPVEGAAAYRVSYSGADIADKIIDTELIRSYPSYIRADIPGLRPGSYSVTVTAVGPTGTTIDNTVTDPVTVTPFVREGFAFRNGYVPGGYNADGTPKEGAKIIYITSETARTVTLELVTDAKGKTSIGTGIDGILKIKNKGYDKTPLIFRFIGCVRAEDMNTLKGGNYIELTGANSDKRMTENITIEGIGYDAVCYGYGIFTKRCHGIEIRNLGIMLFGDDGVSMEADNSNIWVHHCDFFYGKPGSDKDQVKGDGSIDMKYNTTDITIDHNHFWDCGKTTFAGGATENNPIYFTYHHNWFDHADSRCPRLCHATAHIYNNYFDANATMCLLSTEDTSAFVESNYYRNCPSPMEINMQGTNRRRWPDGKQNGGMNKGYGNVYEGKYELVTQVDNPTDFDVYLVNDRSERLPANVKSLKGGNTYSNFDTDETMYAYSPHNAADVPAYVTANAGRMEGGDLQWTFDNDVDDALTAINIPLKNALLNYKSNLIGIFEGSSQSGLTPVAEAATDCVYEIFDLAGRRVMSSLSDLPSGIYIVRTAGNVKKIKM